MHCDMEDCDDLEEVMDDFCHGLAHLGIVDGGVAALVVAIIVLI